IYTTLAFNENAYLARLHGFSTADIHSVCNCVEKAYTKTANPVSRGNVPDHCASAGPDRRQTFPVYRPAADFYASVRVFGVPGQFFRRIALRSKNPYVGIVP